ncbi:MAG: hypothetical protein ACYDH3_00150 [Candidatus Aminicenantales bacterium]
MTQSLKEDGRPATLWFWDDWFSSFDVRACSLAARGLWMDMLGIMARSEIMGTLTINGKQIDGTTLSRIVGTPEAEINSLLSELEDNRVFSRLPDATIINRRMFGDSQRKELISKIKSSAGKKGAESRWQTDGKAMANQQEEGMAKGMAKMALPIQTKPSSTQKTYIQGIIQSWNSLNIRNLKEGESKVREKTEAKIESVLKDYPAEVVVKAIENYGHIIQHPDEFFFSYKWELVEFLQRGLRKFMDDAKPFENFRIKNAEVKASRVGENTKADPKATASMKRAAEYRAKLYAEGKMTETEIQDAVAEYVNQGGTS